MNRVWTEEELEILRRDREAKVPVPVTAAKLGRPVPATYARARLIGTLVQPHQSWNEASIASLRALVCADPPMTDKRIAAELGRTVTQIRWKMQDLGLIGVRDLSKLAKMTAASSARPKRPPAQLAKPRPAKPAAGKLLPEQIASSQVKQVKDKAAGPAPATPVRVARPQAFDPQAALNKVLNDLEALMAERLKGLIAETEAGMVKAARAAIAEKGYIDQRLIIRGKRAAEAEACLQATAKQIEVEASKNESEEHARQARKRCLREKPVASKSLDTLRSVEKKPILSAVQGISQLATCRPALPSPAPSVPKIIVTEAPAPIRPAEAAPASAPISGRGGWKSVRRDPARVLAKAKPANRADAVDLAQAAQAAIERFIAERGVTRTESVGIQALVSRLQARGYIVVRDESGWTIDQRHRVNSEPELLAFAEARGITLSAAA